MFGRQTNLFLTLWPSSHQRSSNHCSAFNHATFSLHGSLARCPTPPVLFSTHHFCPLCLCLCCVDRESWAKQHQDRTFLIVLPALAQTSHLSVGPLFVICDPECLFFSCVHASMQVRFFLSLPITEVHYPRSLREFTVLHIPNLAEAAFQKHCPNHSWPFLQPV